MCCPYPHVSFLVGLSWSCCTWFRFIIQNFGPKLGFCCCNVKFLLLTENMIFNRIHVGLSLNIEWQRRIHVANPKVLKLGFVVVSVMVVL
jgi:hypothetical protein